MKSSIIFVFILAIVKQESLGQDDGPACPNRKALPFIQTLMGQLPKNWFVNRLTIMTKLPASAPDPPTENCCDSLSYLADCKGNNPIGGIHVYREWTADAGHVKITKTYSDHFKNIAEIWESQMLYDISQTPNLIFGGFISQIYIHTSDKKTREIKSFDFPPLLLYAAARTYAILHYQANLEWIHYMDCDNPVSWVEISENVVNENRVNDINKEIDKYLKANPSIPAMQSIPTVLPF